MSEINYYDPVGNICDNCMGSGHIQKTLFKRNEGMVGYILTLHCPVCNGSGLTQRPPDLGQAVANPSNDDVAPSG